VGSWVWVWSVGSCGERFSVGGVVVGEGEFELELMEWIGRAGGREVAVG
jgi:hypothetical protein